MMLRTPPPKRERERERDDTRPADSPPPSTRRLVIYEDPDPTPHSPQSSHDQMLCTYQCRQLVKSELLDNYGSMEKAMGDYQLKVETLNNNLVKAETESKKYRDQFLYAEQELAAARGREQALQLKELKDINHSEERLKRHIQQCHELEVNLQKEVSMRKSVESKAASAEEKVHLLEEKLKHLSGTVEREKRSLEDEIKHLKEDSNLSISKLRADLDRMECRACSAERESGLLNEKLEEATDQLKKCLHEKAELEKKLTSFTIPKEDAASQNGILVKHLQELLRSYESEVQEARKLKASHEMVELLKEKLVEEKSRRERAETELLKLQEVQHSMKMVEDELSSWKKVMEEIPGISSSDDVRLKFAALQREVIDSMEKISVANARLKQLEVALTTVELDMKSAKTEAALAKEKEESLKSEVKALNSRLSSVIEERDQLRTTIDQLKLQNSVEPGGATVTGTKIEEFGSTLAQKDGYIKELENRLCEQKAANDLHYNEIRMLNEKLNNEERRIKSLEREGDRLRAEIALLESKLGHGDFSADNTKVLRMVNALGVDNEARQTIEALQNELQKAYEKLKVVEELKKQSADAGQLVDSYISGKILQLKEHIATLEKREERYKTVFADRISVFRRACCELFGYKIVMDDRQRPNGIPVTRFTLQSIYAQSDEEKLEFEYESGSTNILVNDYTKQPDISQQVEIFVRKLNSIPAFTANLTIESFNRRTLS